MRLRLGQGWGGRRAGAGRRPKFGHAGVPHVARPAHDARHPVHVTVRVRSGLPSLRTEALFRCVRAQIQAAKRRAIRIVHFSVQSNHIHLLVEATDRRAMGRGMKGFAVRVARHVNGLLSSKGKVWADRYHARALQTPREVRNALVYVLFNRYEHGGGMGIDPRSSTMFLDRRAGVGEPVERARTWLLSQAWKRLGPLDPGARPRRADQDRSRRELERPPERASRSSTGVGVKTPRPSGAP